MFVVVFINSSTTSVCYLSFQIKVSVLLTDLFSVLSRHRVKLESNFVTIILAMTVLEGLGRSLDPDLDILRKASRLLLGGALTSRPPPPTPW